MIETEPCWAHIAAWPKQQCCNTHRSQSRRMLTDEHPPPTQTLPAQAWNIARAGPGIGKAGPCTSRVAFTSRSRNKVVCGYPVVSSDEKLPEHHRAGADYRVLPDPDAVAQSEARRKTDTSGLRHRPRTGGLGGWYAMLPAALCGSTASLPVHLPASPQPRPDTRYQFRRPRHRAQLRNPARPHTAGITATKKWRRPAKRRSKEAVHPSNVAARRGRQPEAAQVL